MVFTPQPRISIQLRMSYAQIHNFRWFKILQARIFHELFRIFLSPEGTRIKEGNEQDFFSCYMINHRTGLMVFTPQPRISIKLRMSYAQIHNFRWFKILQARIFHELFRIFLSPEGTRIKEGNEQDFFSCYMINHRTNEGFIISLLLGIFFSNMRPRSDNYPPPPFSPLTFLNSIGTRKICFYSHTYL